MSETDYNILNYNYKRQVNENERLRDIIKEKDKEIELLKEKIDNQGSDQ